MSRRSSNQVDEKSPESGVNVFWRSLEEKADPASLKAAKEAEFAPGLGPMPDVVAAAARETASERLDKIPVDRRGFLKFGTAVSALFGLEGCIRRPVEKVLPYTKAPEYQVPGVSSFYATILSSRGDVVGVVAEAHEGRPTKIEGNPDHPMSLGGADLLAQGAIMDLYNPERSTHVRTTVGATPLTVMPCGASSLACWRISMTSPPLVLQ